ncbi:hypothetical protein HK101_002958 [Irineochytrium annulatum]|nr:hypothetical protein HK101_002958 [Irineochytrium annulatum]
MGALGSPPVWFVILVSLTAAVFVGGLALVVYRRGPCSGRRHAEDAEEDVGAKWWWGKSKRMDDDKETWRSGEVEAYDGPTRNASAEANSTTPPEAPTLHSRIDGSGRFSSLPPAAGRTSGDSSESRRSSGLATATMQAIGFEFEESSDFGGRPQSARIGNDLSMDLGSGVGAFAPMGSVVRTGDGSLRDMVSDGGTLRSKMSGSRMSNGGAVHERAASSQWDESDSAGRDSAGMDIPPPPVAFITTVRDEHQLMKTATSVDERVSNWIFSLDRRLNPSVHTTPTANSIGTSTSAAPSTSTDIKVKKSASRDVLSATAGSSTPGRSSSPSAPPTEPKKRVSVGPGPLLSFDAGTIANSSAPLDIKVKKSTSRDVLSVIPNSSTSGRSSGQVPPIQELKKRSSVPNPLLTFDSIPATATNTPRSFTAAHTLPLNPGFRATASPLQSPTTATPREDAVPSTAAGTPPQSRRRPRANSRPNPVTSTEVAQPELASADLPPQSLSANVPRKSTQPGSTQAGQNGAIAAVAAAAPSPQSSPALSDRNRSRRKKKEAEAAASHPTAAAPEEEKVAVKPEKRRTPSVGGSPVPVADGGTDDIKAPRGKTAERRRTRPQSVGPVIGGDANNATSAGTNYERRRRRTPSVGGSPVVVASQGRNGPAREVAKGGEKAAGVDKDITKEEEDEEDAMPLASIALAKLQQNIEAMSASKS